MNLTFGICWIEDQASDAEVEAVEEAVRNCGFAPELKRISKEKDIQEFAQKQEHFQDYDLILLDLRLGENLHGDELAPQVRQHFRATPILFYSAEEVNTLRRKMADKLVEGVYCAHRSRLPERIRDLVSDLSPALNRLSGMRGLAARVVAECDHEFRAILLHWGKEREVEANITDSIREQAQQRSDDQLRQAANITDLVDLLDNPVSSSNVLFMEVYKRLDKMDVSDEVKTTRRELRKYSEKVLAVRNKLAHALEERTADGWKITRQPPNRDLRVQDFEQYRSDFLTHLRHVCQLRKLLIGQ